ncbi:hypothetical protein WMY93_001995 [Mugilogobius chulae]|uniref:Putative sodium-coupled neutral amino acid transporter 11 n=1 Tax=Mugilogobius chulae TaxID=88201 RepID=A0AAW0Q3H5_9GOBI
MVSASFNFINSIIGSGIIGLPYALSQAGLPFGLLLLIVVGFITDYTIILLIKGGNLSGTNSYQALVQSTFGLPGFFVLSALQFLYPFIAMISYNITTGDTLTKVFLRIPGGTTTSTVTNVNCKSVFYRCFFLFAVGPGHILAERHFVILVITLMFTLPLSLYRNIERLGKVSFLSMALTLTVLVIVIIRSATLGPEIVYLPHNSFLIYGSLQEPTVSHWTRVTHVSVGSALVISAAFAVAGYATFTGYTQDVCRCTRSRSLDNSWFKTCEPISCFILTNSARKKYMEYDEYRLIISSTTTNMTQMWLCRCSECHPSDLHPAVCLLPEAVSRALVHSHNLLPCALIGLGLFFMITGLTLTGVSQQDCSHGVEMFYCTDANLTNAPEL